MLSRIVGVLALVLIFAFAIVLTQPSASHAQDKEKKKKGKKHPEIRKALADLKDAHARMKKLKPVYNGHRVKAMKAIETAIKECQEAIKYVDSDGKNK